MIKPSKIRRVLVVAYCTVWLTVPRTHGWLCIAVIGCPDRERPGSLAVDTIAVPPLRVAVPSAVVPCLNVAMPVAPPGALDTNSATSLTVCPEADGFGLEVTVAVEA